MNILIINPNYYRSSGVTVAINRLVGALKLTGDINLLFADCAYGNALERDISSCDLPLSATFPLMSKSPFIFFAGCLKLLLFLRKNKIDLIHAHHRRIALVAGLAGKLIGVRTVYTGHLTYAPSLAFSFAPIAAGIAITNSVAANMRTTTNSKSIHIVSNVVEFPPACPSRRTIGKPILITCIARLEPVKNHETLLKAWSLLNLDPKVVRLQLVGEGASRSRLQALANDLGIASVVDFLGYRSDVGRILSETFFCILPSLVEGQGLATVEAAAAGVPSLVTDVDGSRDCVPPSTSLKNLVSPHSAQEMADVIDQWIRFPQKVIEDGRIFYSYWKERASPHVVGRLTHGIYKQALTGLDLSS